MSAPHNRMADRESRISNNNIEFEVPKEKFELIVKKIRVPCYIFFASYQNKKCDRIISRYPM